MSDFDFIAGSYAQFALWNKVDETYWLHLACQRARAIVIKRRAEEVLTQLESTLRLFKYGRTDNFYPMGRCAIASLFAAPFLRSYTEQDDIRVYIGSAGHCARHAWCQDQRGWVYDPTYGQLDSDWEPSFRVLEPYQAQAMNYAHERSLTLPDEDFSRTTINADGTSWVWDNSSKKKRSFALVQPRTVSCQ